MRTVVAWENTGQSADRKEKLTPQEIASTTEDAASELEHQGIEPKILPEGAHEESLRTCESYRPLYPEASESKA